jgi:hypothetical protein
MNYEVSFTLKHRKKAPRIGTPFFYNYEVVCLSYNYFSYISSTLHDIDSCRNGYRLIC